MLLSGDQNINDAEAAAVTVNPPLLPSPLLLPAPLRGHGKLEHG